MNIIEFGLLLLCILCVGLGLSFGLDAAAASFGSLGVGILLLVAAGLVAGALWVLRRRHQ